MRVVVVSPMPPARDGLADYSAHVCRAYATAGHPVGVVTTTRAADAVPAEPLGRLTASPLSALRAARATRRWGAELVHVEHGIATYAVALVSVWTFVLLARRSGAAIVVTHHEVTRDTARLGAPGRWYYGLVSRWANAVHVHTAEAAGLLVQQMGVEPEHVVVSPHPVFRAPEVGTTAAELVERRGLSGRRLLLLFGYVHVEKGLAELVEGLAVLLQRRKDLAGDVTLVVAGAVRPRPRAFARFERADVAYLAAVRRRVADLGLADSVTFTGAVPGNEVGGWFHAATAAVLPYTQVEQSGVANIAVSCGTPVLATRTGGLGELFAGRVPTFASLSAGDVADALEQLLDVDGRRPDYDGLYDRLRDEASPGTLVERVVAAVGRAVDELPAGVPS